MAIFFAVSAQLPSPALASQFTISPVDEVSKIGGKFNYLTDPSKSLNLQQFRSPKNQEKLKPIGMDTPSFGYTSDTYWLQIQLVHNENQETSKTLLIAYPLLDVLNVYVIRPQGHITAYETGDTKPFTQRPIPHHHFAFPINFQPRETITLVIQATTASSMQIPVELWSPDKLHQSDKESLLAQGIYYGIMLIMVIYNLFVFLAVRSFGYLFYVIHVATITLTQASINGIGYQFLWPENSWFQQITVSFFVPAAGFTALLFSISLMQTSRNNPRAHKLLKLLATICVGLALASFVVPYAVIIKPILLVIFISILSVSAVGLINWKKDIGAAKYFTLAWVSFFGGSLLIILNKTGIVPRNFITENAMQIGSVLEVSLLSFALAYRMNTLQADKIAAEKRSQELQGALNTELKTKLNIFSSIAHELNNPLNYVSVGTQNLRRQVAKLHTIVSQIFVGAEDNENAMEVKRALDETFDEHSRTLEGTLFGAQRAADVVAEMRGLTEVDGKLLRTSDPKALIESAVRRARDILSADKFDKVNIDYDYDDVELEVEVNPYLVTHALTNIITNAVRYALTQDQEMPQVKLHAHMLDNMVHMVVANNGEPISEDMMEKIFDDGVSDNPVNNLSVSRSLIRQQGGELELKQSGSHTAPVEFQIKLPKSAAGDEPAALS